MSVFTVLLVLLLGLIGFGVVYQRYATRRDIQKYPPPGQMVEAGGFQMHMQIAGKEQAAPTVILDAGMVSFSANWAWVQPEVAKFARVVAYDRARLGWSDPAPAKPRDAGTSAKELHTALQNAGLSGPYVLAGHSYGGLMIRAFTALYPGEVAGLVLVDGSHPDQWVRMGVKSRVVGISNRVSAFLARAGLFRLFQQEAETLAGGLPPQQYGEIKAFCMQPYALATGGDALAVWDDISRPLVNNAGDLGNRPLVVLSVTEQPRMGEKLTELQAELPGLSTNSKHITVQGATHEGLVSRKENAQFVIDAIRDVVEAVRTGGRVISE